LNIKVCYLTSVFPPTHIGGVEKYILNIIDSLKRKDLTPMIMTRYYPPLKKKEKMNGLSIFRIGLNPIPYFTIRYISSFLRIIENYINYSLIGFFQSFKYISQVDIIHSNLGDKWDLFLGNKLSKKMNKKHVVTIHGRFGNKPGDINLSEKLLNNLKKTDYIIVNRNQTYNLLTKKGFKNIELIRNAIPVSKFKKPENHLNLINNNKTIVLFIGRLCYRRGPQLALRSFLLAAKECSNTELWIIGDGELERELKSISSESQYNDKVLFFRRQNDVRKFLWDSDIFLATSPIANSPSLSLREAMASGLVVVATNVEETDKLINEENGILVSSDINNIKDCIIKLIKNEQLRKKLANSALSYANKNFNIDNYVKKLIRIYRKI